jgi:flagellar basal body-associated protein FliL
LDQKHNCLYCGTEIIGENKNCPECGAAFFPSISEETYDHKSNYMPKYKTNNIIIVMISVLLVVIVLMVVLAIVLISNIGFQNYEDENERPRVVKTEPEDGAVDISPRFTLKIFFSKDMNMSTSVHLAIWGVNTTQAETKWIDVKTVEIRDLIAENFGTIYLSLDNDLEMGIMDLDGNNLDNPYFWTFTTRPMEVDILSSTVYNSPDSDYYNIYGELWNREEFNLKFIIIEVTAIDINGNSVALDWLNIWTKPHSVMPDEVVPFIGSYQDEENIVEDLLMEITNDAEIELEPRYQDLVIIREEAYFDDSWGSNVHILNFTIGNGGNRLARWVTATATLYDSNGKLICVSECYSRLTDLDMGQTLDLEIYTYESQCDLDSIDSYRLIVHEYI